jgi:hypothetical protein
VTQGAGLTQKSDSLVPIPLREVGFARTFRKPGFFASLRMTQGKFHSKIRLHSILPEVVGCVFQDHVYAGFAVAVFEEVFYHRVVFFALFFVSGASLGDDS